MLRDPGLVAFFNNHLHPIIEIDTHDRVIRANTESKSYFGDIIGKMLDDFLWEDDLAVILNGILLVKESHEAIRTTNVFRSGLVEIVIIPYISSVFNEDMNIFIEFIIK